MDALKYEKLQNWINNNSLDIKKVSENLLQLEGTETFFYVLPFKDVLFDENLFFNLEEEEFEEIMEIKEEVKQLNLLFEFGAEFYYCPIVKMKDQYNDERLQISINDFLYLGKSTKQITYPVLGLHTEYEILNVACNYATSVKKAKFLGVKTLAICDSNTLGGALGFQLKCSSEGIKSIIGETVTVAYDYKEGSTNQVTHEVKLYVTNEAGWDNLLEINKKINVDYNGLFIPEEQLLQHTNGLICVFDYANSVLRDVTVEKEYEQILNRYKKFFRVYYQFSSSQFLDQGYDLKCLNGFKFFLNNYSDRIPFVFIDDIHYLEKYQSHCKDLLNKVGGFVKQPFKDNSFKTYEDVEKVIKPLFEGSKFTYEDVISKALSNATELGLLCNFSITLSENKLPKFELDGELLSEEESNLLLRQICEEGFQRRILDKGLKPKKYRERLEKEYTVITEAGFADYFLILWDMILFAKDNEVLIGPGRGSVGGSLLAYLIGIIDIDPIKYDLLFERFLNEARVAPELYRVYKFEDGTEKKIKEGEKLEEALLKKKVVSEEVVKEKRADSLPDVDCDFMSQYRDDIKAYLSFKYGQDQVCSLGTYGRLKLRQSFKDLAKQKGIDFKTANDLTKEMDDQLEYTWFDLFKFAAKSKSLYEFIQNYPDLISDLKVILNNPKSVSIHPSAVAILPKYNIKGERKKLNTWMPIRKVDGMIISEWEGKYTDKFGVLKEDILGISQLDKFKYCLSLIEQNRGEVIDLNEIPLDDLKTYKLFQKGLNEDVFQFGSYGLKSYSKEVAPDTIEDLIAMNALYRPGPMDSGFHKDYALIKHGKKDINYLWGMDEVTRDTNGLFIYQEQIMKAVMVGGLTAVESDNVRTAMKKFDAKLLGSFGDKFIKGMVDQDCDEDVAKDIWNKLLAFSGYGFNRSHSAAYALIAYQCQWLKANYPLEFWTTAFNFGKEDVDIPYYIKEIKDSKAKIKVNSPDINQSKKNFTCNADENAIFWSITKIKGIGDAVADKILEERTKGDFTSLRDFYDRVPKSKVNKKVVKLLILTGSFDKLEGVKEPKDRKNILIKFYQMIREDADKCEYCSNQGSDKNYYWMLLQKSLTGIGDVDFEDIVKNLSKKHSSNYLSIEEAYSKKIADGKFYNGQSHMVSICGFVDIIKEYKGKKGTFGKIIIEANGEAFDIVCWRDEYADMKEMLQGLVKKLIIITGRLGWDRYSKKNTLYVNPETEIFEP